MGYPSAEHIESIVAEILAYRQRVSDSLDHAEGGPLHVLLCPPCGLPAYTHGARSQLGVSGGYAVPYNLLGYPAGIVPVTRVEPNDEIGRIT